MISQWIYSRPSMSAEAIKQAHGTVLYFVFSGRIKLDVGKLVWTSAISNPWFASF